MAKLYICHGRFNIDKGVRQGGVLSPFLFSFYIRALIDKVTKLNVGRNIAGTMINLLANVLMILCF